MFVFFFVFFFSSRRRHTRLQGDWSSDVCSSDLWLAAHYPIDGFVVIVKTRPWWGKYLWKRTRRLGLLKVLDELVFRLYWLLFKSFTDRMMTKKLLEKLKGDLPETYKRPPVYHIYDINSSESEVLLKQLAPDVCV